MMVSPATTNLGQRVISEKTRFRSILNNLPDRPGHGRYVQVNGTGDIQGFAFQDPAKEDGWFLHYRDPNSDKPGATISVHYETKFPDQEHPQESVIKRMIMYDKDDHSNPELWKLETWHRDTIVREKDGFILCDQARHTTAVYPGTGNVRSGIIVGDEPLVELPLSETQQAGLLIWNIAY